MFCRNRIRLRNTCKKRQEERGGSTKLREREGVELVTGINGIWMSTDGEKEEERGIWCIMRSPLAVLAYRSITTTRRWLWTTLSSLSLYHLFKCDTANCHKVYPACKYANVFMPHANIDETHGCKHVLRCKLIFHYLQIFIFSFALFYRDIFCYCDISILLKSALFFLSVQLSISTFSQ